MKTVALGPGYRGEALRRLADETFDVLVVGGGVVGAGTALDAVSRGLSVALVEQRDFAAGTSSRSSRLIHGGLRYLEQRDFRLVREALRERGLLLTRLAPHLVRPIRFLLPLRHRIIERCYFGTGVLLYDVMGGARTLPHHRHLSRESLLRAAPGLRADDVVGAIQYYDAQVDDARYTMTLARTAATYGAVVTTRTRVVGLTRSGVRVTGARVVDVESGGEITVRARQVISATGVWTGDIDTMVGATGQIGISASKGVHLVVPRDRIELETGLILRTEKSVLFVIPWHQHWLVGTTDTPWRGDRSDPAASGADVDYLLEHLNAVLTTPLTREDVEGVYTGLRPLVAARETETARLSREHAVVRPAPGLVIVAGGKYTTYRVMARDAVDAATAGLDEVPGSATERIPLLGAVGYEARWNARRRLAERHGLSVARLEHLLGRYGSCVDDLLDLIAADPALGAPVEGAADYLAAEVVYAVTHEGASHLEDILVRRTRIATEVRDGGAMAAPYVARLVGPLLGWDADTTEREIDRYLADLAADREAQRAADDTAADAARRRGAGSAVAA